MNEPRQELERGAELLAAVLDRCGFSFELESSGDGSGGPFAAGRFVRDTRQLSLFHRFGLVNAVYSFDDLIVPHSDYLIALGVNDQSEFLSTPMDAGLDRYHSLAKDLKRFCTDFTTGDASVLIAAARSHSDAIEACGQKLNAEAVGDIKKRQLARNAFRNKRYSDVIELMESITYPELVTASEKQMIELARSRKDGT